MNDDKEDDNTIILSTIDNCNDFTITGDINMNDTIVFDTSGAGQTITFDTSSLTTDDFDYGSITLNSKEFVDVMPSVGKIDSMCEEYPSLKQAYEKFKQIYYLCKDDYEGDIDDELPF
jgi:hypothetical protein